MSELLGVKLPLCPWDLGVAKLLGSCDPVILRVLERLRVVVSQGVEGLVGELAPRVNQPRW